MKVTTSQRRLTSFPNSRKVFAGYDSDEEEEETSITPKPQKPSSSLSTQEAIEYFTAMVGDLPPGTRFTSMALFRGVRLRSDKRARGQVIGALKRAGLIDLCGYTTMDQEGRNCGVAALWKVKEDE